MLDLNFALVSKGTKRDGVIRGDCKHDRHEGKQQATNFYTHPINTRNQINNIECDEINMYAKKSQISSNKDQLLTRRAVA